MKPKHRRGPHGQEEAFAPVLEPLPGSPLVLAREEHNISRKLIDGDCLKVMGRLLRHGHRAFLVGGGVRDLLLGKQPKDFDIGTDARPEAVRALFRNSRIIGRRFRINHIYFTGNKIFEVSTFRATTDPEAVSDGMPIRSDNTYGDPESDALRRDLTINGLFYDLATFSVIDYVGGIRDLRDGIIRVIGDPPARFQEDPVRMIRAVRHAARTGFRIEENTLNAIYDLRHLIKLASPARVFEEVVREFQMGYARESLRLLSETGLLPYLLPSLAEMLESGGPRAACTLELTLTKLDAARRAGDELSLAVIFSALFIGNFPVNQLRDELPNEPWDDICTLWKLNPFAAPEGDPDGEENTGGHRIRPSCLNRCVELLFKPAGVPRKERERIPQIVAGRCMLVALFHERGSGKSAALLEKPYFRESLQLLDLTAHDDDLRACVEYWKEKSTDDSEGGGRRSRRGSRRRRRHRGRPRGVAMQ